MKWLARLWGTPDEREGDKDLAELRAVSKRVSRRTDRIMEDYKEAELLRLGKKA